MPLFFRLLDPAPDDKGHALAAQVHAHNAGAPHPDTFAADAADFSKIPGSPFAYWADERVRGLFATQQSLSERGISAQHGASSKYDFRFLRLWWEVAPETLGSRWFDFAKGGQFSPYYADVHLLINWENNAAEINDYLLDRYPYLRPPENDKSGRRGTEWILHPENSYFRPGLTWPLRTNGFSIRVLPQDCIFGHKGPAAFVADDDHEALLALAAVMNSQAFGNLISLQLARTELAQSYEVGLIRSTPVPPIDDDARAALAALALAAHDLQRQNYVNDETAHVFGIPALAAARHQPTLHDAARAHDTAAAQRAARLASLQAEIDERVAELYGVTLRDTKYEIRDTSEEEEDEDEAEDDDSELASRLSYLVSDLLMYCVGVAFGRWDIDYALDPARLPPLPGPFDPLPPRAPGAIMTNDELRMTNDEDEDEDDDSELVTRHSTLVTHNSSLGTFLVDDPDHPHDIVRHVRRALGALYGDRADAIEREACAALDVDDLRGYFRDPRRFFAHHVRRYSKSRRKAPIYWPLQSARRSYTLWLYYPALRPGHYLQLARDVVDPRVRRQELALDDLRANVPQATAARRRREREIGRAEAALAELNAFRRELDRVGIARLEPDPNDGVLISIAPLHRLVPWKEAAAAHRALLAGQYEWSDMAPRLAQAHARQERLRTSREL